MTRRARRALPRFGVVMRGMPSIILDGQGLNATALPAAMLAGMGVIFAVVALQRLRFDDKKSGWV